MRTSTLFISLALILCAQVYAGDLASGKWSKPTTKTDADAACCVPDSIEIDGSSALYSFGLLNAKCQFLFATKRIADQALGTNSKDELIITKKTDYYGAAIKLLNVAPLEAFRYIVNSDSSKLNVLSVPQTKEDQTFYEAGTLCDFTMNEFKPASNLLLYLIIGAIILVVVVIFLKSRQSKQASMLQENLQGSFATKP